MQRIKRKKSELKEKMKKKKTIKDMIKKNTEM